MSEELRYEMGKYFKVVIKTTDDLHDRPFVFPGFLVVLFFPIIIGFIFCIVSPGLLFVLLKAVASLLINYSLLVVLSFGLFVYGFSRYCKSVNDGKKIRIIDITKDGILVGRMSKSGSAEVLDPRYQERKSGFVFASGKQSLPTTSIDYFNHGNDRGQIIQLIPFRELVSVEVDDPDKSGKYEYIYIERDRGRIYEIAWQNAFWWVKEETFFSTVRANCRDIKLKLPQKSKHNSSDDVTYTKLWLENFSKQEKRVRTGALETGAELNGGQYTVVEKLGAGGQGSAYLASMSFSNALESNCKDVVLKEYILPSNRGMSMQAGKAKALEHEADILSKIDHPQIVSFLDCFVEDHRGYLVLEYIRGHSLRDLIKSNGPASPHDVIDWSLQICDILHYLHGLLPPIIHRDLTPDNLILGTDSKVKLFDFTVAHQFESSRSATVVGKQSYISPEQFGGEPCPASDIYSLGCSMYYFLTGVDPEPLAVSWSGGEAEGDGINIALGGIIKRSTELDLERRYQSALHMKADLFKLTNP